MVINWFPGHMLKTQRLILENLKLVDIVIELLDARIPLASKNPLIDKLIANKPRLVVFNKSDLADDKVTDKWISFYDKQGIKAIKVNSMTGGGTSNIYSEIDKILADKIKGYKEKGAKLIIKMMVVGIPNVGKSSFINKLSKRAGAKTGNKPGVTRGKQWIRLKEGFDLLDTPGILWHKFEDINVGKKLAFVGSVKDEVLDIEELSCDLLSFLKTHYKSNLIKRYQIDFSPSITPYELLCLIGEKRGFIIKGGEIDTLRTARTVMDELRASKLGKISLEMPDEVL